MVILLFQKLFFTVKLLPKPEPKFRTPFWRQLSSKSSREILLDSIKPWRVGALRVSTFHIFFYINSLMKVLKLALTHRGFVLTIFIKAFGNNMGRFRWCESWSNNMVIIWLIGPAIVSFHYLLSLLSSYCKKIKTK